MAEAAVVDNETQKKQIAELLKTQLSKGETWYLIDSRWFKQWKKYVGYDNWDVSFVGDEGAHPGPIDNKGLLKEGSNDQLREHLIEELDHILVPTEAWNKLVCWYGIMEEQSSLGRHVIEQGMFVKHCKVEVYLMDLKLCSNSDINEVKTQQFSRVSTVEEIEQEMRTLFGIEAETEVRLWNKYMSNTYERLSKPDNTVQDAGLYQGQVIVIEQKNEDGTWPRQSKAGVSTSASTSTSTDDNERMSTSPVNGPANKVSTNTSYTNSYNNTNSYNSSNNYSNNYYNSSNYSYDYRGNSASPGLCGLSNLGNTCFMNSALQCMSNVPELTDYFLSEQWTKELNADNPLGMKGEIATSFAELIRNMWSGKHSYTVPRNFKIAVGRFAPQFSGYQQQDSQELMAFLLDGLHEDLNRIKKKPYIELKDYDGRPDDDVADEAWENYLKRNNSVITDIFHGLLKSTLVCPECNNVSKTFDPFCYLSLPLPIRKERQIEVFLVQMDPAAKPRRYKVTVPKLGTITDLCKALSKLVPDIAADRMVVTDVYNHRFHKLFAPDEGLSHILDKDDIFVYEVPVNSADDPDTLVLSVYLREKKSRVGYNDIRHTVTQLFGQPLLVAVPRNTCSYDTLYNCVLNKMSRYVKIPDQDDVWRKIDNSININKENETNETTNGHVNGTNGKVNGPNEGNGMDELDNSHTDNSHTEEKTDDETINQNSAQDAGDTGETKSKSSVKPRLFTFQVVNSYGTMDVDDIQDDGEYIKFQSRSYIAIDWNKKAIEQCYDDKSSEEFEEDESMNYRPVQKRHSIQLTECLSLFTNLEKLGAQDPWYCPQCKKHQQATKQFDLWSLPDILVIHLKRFSYNRYLRDKLDTLVDFPTRGLDLKDVVKKENHGPAIYDLLSVANHFGGMGGGHYTAFAKNKDDGQWYNFDDSSVSQTSEDSVVTKAAYVLVYKLRGSEKVQPGCDAAAGSKATLVDSAATLVEESADVAPGQPEECDMDMDVN